MARFTPGEMIPKLHIYNSITTFEEAVISSIRSRILKKNREGNIFRLALSGGSTPGPIYKKLSESHDIDWSLVEFYLVDERKVPLTSKDSNFKMIQETLIKNLPKEPAKWVYFQVELSEKECLKKYEEQINHHDSEFFDLIILGVGTDGHTASLFPNTPALKEKKKWVLSTKAKNQEIRDRYTLSYPALMNSKEIFFLVKGKEKAKILKKIEKPSAKNDQYPAARLFHLEKTQAFYFEG